jgi:hypothetical protein
MKKSKFDDLFQNIMLQIKDTRDDGQKEYAHTEDNVFANFERVAENLDICKEKALMVYLLKHMDGINAWVKGHKSQREDVRGRIKDAIVYLCLLWGMAEENNELDAFNFDVKKMEKFSLSQAKNGSIFDPATGEVKYTEQSLGDECV